MAKFIQEAPKHKCGEYYSLVGNIIQHKSDKEKIDLGVAYHCRHCDIYFFGNKEFHSHKEFNSFIKRDKRSLELIIT